MAGEYAVKITVRNALILRRMKAVGVKSQTELAKLAGMPLTTLNALITLRQAPKNKITGDWSDAAFALSSALQVEPEELWTEAQSSMALDRNSYETSMDEEGVRRLASGEGADRLALDSERRRALTASMQTLRAREEYVLRRRFYDDDTLDTIAKDMDLTPDRVRVIEATAVRRLRHPSRGLKAHKLNIEKGKK
jgi:DNA-directed RNA polymerase sigma subunit (sigma70/sigma32)